VPNSERRVVGDALTLVWDERLTGYDFGPGHPLAPVRVELRKRSEENKKKKLKKA